MVSIIIPTKTEKLITSCVKHIQDNLGEFFRGDVEILVVDDGLPPGVVNNLQANGARVVAGEKPFVFARNVNVGLKTRQLNSDVLLLNDDARILTPGYLQALYDAAQGFDVVCPSITDARSVGQRLQVHNPREAHNLITPVPIGTMLCFVAVFFKAKVLQRVGGLDERYDGYGHEDDDWCKRAWLLNCSMGVCHQVRVEHGDGVRKYSSTYATVPNYTELSQRNREHLKRKWDES